MAFSLIQWIDGSSDCDAPSHLGYWGLIIWTLVIIYLFVGLYVLCEIYFVPILIAISRRLNMSEDVAGATLMAAGSSAPELFTAIIGVLVYPDENPGPSTNCASAAFNMCVIIGCSIFFSGYQALPIRGYPFIRDCFFYAIAVIELYLFWEVITPARIQWGESLFLVLSWCAYIVVLMYNNRVIKLMVSLMSWMGLANAEEMMYEQLKPSMQRKGPHSHSLSHSDSDDATDGGGIAVYHSVTGDAPCFDSRTAIRSRSRSPFDSECHSSSHSHSHSNTNTVPSSSLLPAVAPTTSTLPHSHSTERGASSSNDQLLDHDDQRIDNVEIHDDRSSAFIAMELEEMDCHQILSQQHVANNLNHGSAVKSGSLRVHKAAPNQYPSRHNNAHHRPPHHQQHGGDHEVAAGSGSKLGSDHGIGVGVGVGAPAHSQHQHGHQAQSGCGRVFEGAMQPFHFAFKWTVPKTNDESTTWKLMVSFCLVLVWLGGLTFVCVDAAEKMGNCLKISEDVMGLTLLAIGSSLPDCFSSVLAAKQGKGEMAVSNALGSNVFDINICIGVSFLTSSMVKGFKAIIVEHDEGFELFIAALFVLLAIFMVAMFCYGLVLNKNIGAGLMAAYAVFLGAFCYLLQFD